MKRLSLALATGVLAACNPTGGGNVASTPPAPTARVAKVPAQRAAPPASARFRAPKVMAAQGLEGVIGANTAALQRQFGAPRLDVWEGDARKLQFSGEACVLDVYLYPPSPGAAATATYIDARRASDGQDVDRSACVRALRR